MNLPIYGTMRTISVPTIAAPLMVSPSSTAWVSFGFNCSASVSMWMTTDTDYAEIWT